MNEFKQSADEDENDLADFLGDLPEDQVQLLTGMQNFKSVDTNWRTDEFTKQVSQSAFMSNYEIVIK